MTCPSNPSKWLAISSEQSKLSNRDQKGRTNKGRQLIAAVDHKVWRTWSMAPPTASSISGLPRQTLSLGTFSCQYNSARHCQRLPTFPSFWSGRWFTGSWGSACLRGHGTRGLGGIRFGGQQFCGLTPRYGKQSPQDLVRMVCMLLDCFT